ncbi:MAG: hypothetical protein WC551_04435 [Patescibacteria group bacterium]
MECNCKECGGECTECVCAKCGAPVDPKAEKCECGSTEMLCKCEGCKEA